MNYKEIFYSSVDEANKDIFFALIDYYINIIKYVNKIIYDSSRNGLIDKSFKNFDDFILEYRNYNKEDKNIYRSYDTIYVLTEYYKKRNIVIDTYGGFTINWKNIL